MLLFGYFKESMTVYSDIKHLAIYWKSLQYFLNNFCYNLYAHKGYWRVYRTQTFYGYILKGSALHKSLN